ncbi:hypothetical protein [Altericista sp. CCNU0014]|uniref:hypothetical protein n=1 Tax=Altericista sp. CCNU0014 TaxID=3082949 RepID=UPI00384FB5B3
MKVNDLDIEVNSPSRLPWLALILLWFAYALVGWNLVAHHVIWFIGLLIVALAMTLSWAGSRWIEQVIERIPSLLLLALTASISVTIAFTSSLFLPLALIPFLTTFLAWNEMRFFNLSQIRTFWGLIAIAVLGLSVGELLDLWVLPSARY